MNAPLHLAAYGFHGRTVSACDRRTHREYRVTDQLTEVTCARCKRTELFERRTRLAREPRTDLTGCDV